MVVPILELQELRGEQVVAICEPEFFVSGDCERLHSSGHRILWGNEMMHVFPGESDAYARRHIDHTLFVSEEQRQSFTPHIGEVSHTVVGNFIHPDLFPFVQRNHERPTLGRLSRPDPSKYPVNFPLFYRDLLVPDARYRVKAWSADLATAFSWYPFGEDWELLSHDEGSAVTFLHSIDLFVYPLGHRFVESWGRSTVEALLTGAIPFVPAGHSFHHLIRHEESGFICGRYEDWRYYVAQVVADPSLRRRLGERCADHARRDLCGIDHHLELWNHALAV